MEQTGRGITYPGIRSRNRFSTPRKWRRNAVSALVGVTALAALAYAGGAARDALHLPLPGPVIGLALLAVILLCVKRFHARAHRHVAIKLLPAGRFLVSHMSLLFVPAGVGIITEGEALRRQGIPLVAVLVGSTIIGLIATGWLMHQLARKNSVSNP